MPKEVIVVGAGPNGLASAITLARAGWRVSVLEAAATPGGGTRTAALTLPGFRHDVCAAVLPLVAGSPFFRALDLDRHGFTLVHPSAPLAHPLDDGTAVVLSRSIADTAAGLGPDGAAYAGLVAPFVDGWQPLMAALLAPPRLPRHPVLLARFALVALRSAIGLAQARFRSVPGRALFAGLAAHSALPLDRAGSAAYGLVLALLGHACGWPVARGGTQRLTEALVAALDDLGGRVVTGQRVEMLAALPKAHAVLLDVTPRQAVGLAGASLPTRYRRRLERYRYGPGAFKIDWALDGPIPWRAAACRGAGTVHVGGTLEEITAAEAAVAAGRDATAPFVLLVQPTVVDPTRAPVGRHTAWAYCHVALGSRTDMTAAIEAQVERFAPGFRQRVLARHTMGPAALERYNDNYVGGDILGGTQDLVQILARPVAALNPYATPVPGLYLCSSSTPPGAGIHGMCGYWAARAALRRPDAERA
jgi:phytoene dehydrogenase-like protein